MAFEEFDRVGTNDPLPQGGFQEFRVPPQAQGAPLPQLSPNQPRQAPDIFNPSSISGLPSAIGARPFTPTAPSDSQTFTFRKGEAESGAPLAGATPTSPQAPQPQVGSGELFDVLQGMSGQQAPQEGLFGEQAPLTPQQAAEQERIMEGIRSGSIGTGAPVAGSNGQITSREQETIDALGGGAEAIKAVREARQQQIIKESGSRAATDKITASLKDQGISQDVIDGALAGTKTQFEKFQEINKLQKRETLKRISTERDQKVMSRLTSKEKRNEDGTAKNDAAVAVDFDNFFSDFGPDPSSDKPNSSFLTPSQRKEFQRIMNEASRGRVSDAKFKRIAKFQKDIEKKREREFAKSEAKKADDALTLAFKKAQTAEDNAQISAIKANLSEIKSRLEDKNSKTKPSKDERKSLNERRAELMGSLGSFVGGTPDPVTDEQIKATIPDATPAELIEIRKGLANGFTLEQMAAK